MKIIFRLILAGALISLGIWLWFVLFPSPEKIIRGQLSKLTRAVSFSENENAFSKMANAESVGEFFSTNAGVTINVSDREQHTFLGRAEITQVAVTSRQAFSSLTMKFPDVSVMVAPDKQSATADVTVEVNIAGERDAIVQEMKFTFEKSEGKWLIKKVETVPTLSILNFEPARIFS